MTMPRPWIRPLTLLPALLAALALVPSCAAVADEDIARSEDELDRSQRWRVVDIDYQVQQTGYWCGPAALRMALSGHRRDLPSQADLARRLGTDTAGTDWIGQITAVANDFTGGRPYRTVEMPNDPPSPAQRARLWDDIVRTVEQNRVVVANIVAPPSNHPPGYPNRTIYHYVAVAGYNPDTRQVYVADSANFGGYQRYWLSLDQLATLIAPKGYSAVIGGTRCPDERGTTIGDIDAKYRALGGCGSMLGRPVDDERETPDKVGRFSHFERGSIYWRQGLGAWEVHGLVRDAWAATGWERGPLGFPVTDERATPDGRGRFNHFDRGAVYWSDATGAHAVHGAIRDAWAAQGWEAGPLGYPTSDEEDVTLAGGEAARQVRFERGAIVWNARTGEVVTRSSAPR